MQHDGHALCRYTLTLHLSLEKGMPPDRQAITGLVCTTVAGAALLRTSGAETVRLCGLPGEPGQHVSRAMLHESWPS